MEPSCLCGIKLTQVLKLDMILCFGDDLLIWFPSNLSTYFRDTSEREGATEIRVIELLLAGDVI